MRVSDTHVGGIDRDTCATWGLFCCADARANATRCTLEHCAASGAAVVGEARAELSASRVQDCLVALSVRRPDPPRARRCGRCGLTRAARTDRRRRDGARARLHAPAQRRGRRGGPSGPRVCQAALYGCAPRPAPRAPRPTSSPRDAALATGNEVHGELWKDATRPRHLREADNTLRNGTGYARAARFAFSSQSAAQIGGGELVDDEDGGLAEMEDEGDEAGVAERGGLAGIAREAFSRAGRERA